MGATSGFALKIIQWIIRGVQLACAAVILGIYSYFLAALSNHDLRISTDVRAVTGIAGSAVLYTLIGLLVLCCVAGLKFTSFIAIILDIAFIGAFIYVAVANRHGASDCRGIVDTPFGRGQGDTIVDGGDGFTSLPSFRTACRLETACLAVAIIAIFFFILSILMEIALARHHHKEKRFGPGPANNYTSGYAAPSGGFFNRLFRRHGAAKSHEDDNALPEHTLPMQLNNNENRNEGRPYSYGTETTAVEPGVGGGRNKMYAGTDGGDFHNKYGAGGYGHPSAGVTSPRGYTGRGAVPAEYSASPAPQVYNYGDGVYDRT